MRKFFVFITSYVLCVFGAYADDVSGLLVAIQNAKNACLGISESISDLKKMAGINTAVTGVGTVSAGVALGTGVVKNNIDKAIESWETSLDDMIKKQQEQNVEFIRINLSDFEKSLDEKIKLTDSVRADIAMTTDLSKKIGNVRTGTLVGTSVLDTAGTIIAANNKVDDDLQTKIDNCVKSVKNLQSEEMRARTENTATDIELSMANKIITNCRGWEFIDLSPINKRASGAAVSGGIGAALAMIGAITSGTSNSDAVRSDNSEDGKQKEKNLNTASNVLAGGATAASGVATIFNATQISAIKKAAEMSDKCEEGLR